MIKEIKTKMLEVVEQDIRITPKNVMRIEAIDYFEKMGDPELIRFRYREFLERIWEYLQAARSAPNADQLAKEIRYMEKYKRAFLLKAWKQGCVEFYMDYEILYDSYPLLTRLYRLWLDKWKNR